MTTERKAEANRENAKKSTGPSTPEGKAAASRNGLKHGLAAETIIVPGEDPDQFEALVADYAAEYQPDTPTDEFLVRQLAMADWRLARLYRLEAAFHTIRHKQQLNHRLEYGDLTVDERLFTNARRDITPESFLYNIHRYEMRLERSAKIAREALERRQLASVSPAAVKQPKAQPSPKIINIETAQRPPEVPKAQPATETEVSAA